MNASYGPDQKDLDYGYAGIAASSGSGFDNFPGTSGKSGFAIPSMPKSDDNAFASVAVSNLVGQQAW